MRVRALFLSPLCVNVSKPVMLKGFCHQSLQDQSPEEELCQVLVCELCQSVHTLF